MSILVTGAAGFIGAGLALRLAGEGRRVVGVDNLGPYYDVALKQARLDRLLRKPGFRFERLDLADRGAAASLFARHAFTTVAHLAAQPGVRHSLEHPETAVDANLVAFCNVIEQARRAGVQHFVFASSSSVYGANHRLPFSESDAVDHPVSLYAATKRANELLAHSYAHVFGLPCTGLRFFTVYGPWMRPDMAVYKFAEAIMRGRPLPVYNRGDMLRDFTYIDDIVEGVVRILGLPPLRRPGAKPYDHGPGRSSAPFRIFNIGNQQPVELLRLIALLEEALGRKAVLDLLPMQPGDMLATAADISDLNAAAGFAPVTPLESGIARFAEWFAEYTRGASRETTARPSVRV
jgi:UDP-glucuronate 4-epimerase